jgi:hypothetical protein
VRKPGRNVLIGPSRPGRMLAGFNGLAVAPVRHCHVRGGSASVRRPDALRWGRTRSGVNTNVVAKWPSATSIVPHCFAAACGGLAAMPIRSFIEPGGFEPETIAAMSEALEAAFKELQDTGEPDVVRERIATRIIAAAKLGERDPPRLLAAALRKSD